MKKIMLVFALALVMALAYAQENRRPARPSRVPAVPYPVEWVQPSGDTIMIRIIGDENWSCRTTEDGFVLAENKKGALCYAKVDKEGGYRATCIVARRPERRRRCELRYIEKMKKNEKLWRRRNE